MTVGPLAGQNALITGAGRGIGAAIARRLDADGARVALVALTPGATEAVHSVIPTRRITQPDEIADVVAFLASDLSRSISGETLCADGGMNATLNLYPQV